MGNSCLNRSKEEKIKDFPETINRRSTFKRTSLPTPIKQKELEFCDFYSEINNMSTRSVSRTSSKDLDNGSLGTNQSSKNLSDENEDNERDVLNDDIDWKLLEEQLKLMNKGTRDTINTQYYTPLSEGGDNWGRNTIQRFSNSTEYFEPRETLSNVVKETI